MAPWRRLLDFVFGRGGAVANAAQAVDRDHRAARERTEVNEAVAEEVRRTRRRRG